MTDDIVNIKIREALAHSGNDKHDAQKLLITWAVRDQQLLLSLTKPHLKAIVAGCIDHLLRDQGGEKKQSGGDHFSEAAISDIVSSARLNIGQDQRRKSILPPPKSTERQASTMRKLAAAFSKKKK